MIILPTSSFTIIIIIVKIAAFGVECTTDEIVNAAEKRLPSIHAVCQLFTRLNYFSTYSTEYNEMQYKIQKSLEGEMHFFVFMNEREKKNEVDNPSQLVVLLKESTK